MTGIEVSHSELKTFQDCERKWYLGYYLGLAPVGERPTGAAKLGTRVHTALELSYGHGLPPRQVIAELYRQAVQDHPLSQQELDAERDLALAMIDGYLQWVEETGVDEGLEIIAVEQDIVVDSSVKGAKFRAKLDQRVYRRQDGARLFLDHKTVGSFEHATTVLHLDSQMRFYAMLDAFQHAKHPTGEARVDGGLFNMLRKSKRTERAKPPFYRREEVRHNLDTLRATWFKANAILARIVDAREMLDANVNHQMVTPPNPSRDCTWKCPFVHVCPLLDDGSRWRDAVAAEFRVVDPYAYYQPVDVEDMRRRLGSDSGRAVQPDRGSAHLPDGTQPN